MTSPHFAAHAPRRSATPLEDIDQVVARLAGNADRWVRTPIERRAELLRHCVKRTRDVAEDWVRVACRAKGLDFNGPRSGEEWLAGPNALIRNLRLLADALDANGKPTPKSVSKHPNGQYVAQIFPIDFYEQATLTGVTVDVWIEPGEEPTQGEIYREKAAGIFRDGKVSLVLGAGNVASIGPMDAVHKLFVEDEVVVIKTNPVNEYLLPYWEEALRPLVDEGFLAIVRGGVRVGQHLVDHPDVATIHLTGSNRTHDAIVWGGDPEEQKRRKATGEKACAKPVTSELGCVTPVLVVPGRWSDSDIDFQARQVAAMVANNASFNCNAAQVLAIADGWVQRDVFLDRVEHHLALTPPRRAYYPGAQERYDEFLRQYPEAVALGPRSETVVPWTMVHEVRPQKGEYALTEEAFCGVLAHTRLKASDAAAFLDAMVDFANDDCWGTLSCSVLIHPETARKHAAKLESAIDRLRFGGIAVNAFAGVIYGLASPPWGAFPGHPPEDIRSGNGKVHNTFLFDHAQKTVLRAPFRMPVTPAWFSDHKAGHQLGPALVNFEADPGIVNLVPVAIAGMKG